MQTIITHVQAMHNDVGNQVIPAYVVKGGVNKPLPVVLHDGLQLSSYCCMDAAKGQCCLWPATVHIYGETAMSNKQRRHQPETENSVLGDNLHVAQQ